MRRFMVGVISGLVAMAAMPEPVEACIHGERVRKQVNPTLRDVRRAERLLAKGKFDKAQRYAHRSFKQVIDQLPPAPTVETDTIVLGSLDSGPALFLRAQRVAAMAAVRSEGKVGPTRAWGGKTQEERSRNLVWAAFVLQFHAALQPDNTILQTEFAEAAAAVPHFEPAAYETLTRLSNDDLMPTARGYALLARLQTQRGDEGGRDVSLARCSDLTGDAKQCDLA